jgi:hypothetical protein
MRQIQRPRRILLDTPVQRLHPRLPWPITRILQKLQSRAPKSILRLEDTLVLQRDFETDGVVALEAALGHVGELEDAGPLEVVALNIVRVEDGVRGVRVECSRVGSPGRWDPAVEDDGALYVCALLQGWGSESAARRKCLPAHDHRSAHLHPFIRNPTLPSVYPSSPTTTS